MTNDEYNYKILDRDYPDADGLLDVPYRCTNCGNVEVLDGYDCLGADGDNVFCNQCHHEGYPRIVERTLWD